MAAEQQSLLDRIELERKASWDKREKPVCDKCGAAMAEYKHTLSKGLCQALIRLYRHGSPARLRDLAFSLAQATNFQKLRYFGLVQQVEIDETRTGKWAITQRGESFVRCVERVPRFVWTFRGEVRRTEGELILITDVIADYSWRIDYAQEAMAVNL